MKKILVVDDDAQGLDSTRRILEFAGYEVLTAGDGEEALDIVDYVYYLSEGVMVAHGTPEELRASKDPLVHQFVWGEADGPVAYQYPSRKFNEELELV